MYVLQGKKNSVADISRALSGRELGKVEGEGEGVCEGDGVHEHCNRGSDDWCSCC